MRNFIQEGVAVTVIAPSGGVLSGAGVLIGAALFGIAATDAIEGAEVEIVTQGVFSLPKASEEIAAGNVVYFDPALGVVSDTDTTATAKIGVCIKLAGSGDPTCLVRLDGVSTALSGA